MSIRPTLRLLIEQRATLTRSEAHDLLNLILAGEASDLELSGMIGALGARGETAAELAGFVDAMRAAATPLPLTDAERETLVDTCGTGGDASGTFNISTAAALVAAAAGATVAKHGNRAVTSKCGSADVLEALGIPVALGPTEAAEALKRHRFAFLHAPSLHPAMKAVMPVRRALGIRTVFNVLGPLANPAGARAQVMGVYSAHLVPLVAEAMQMLGVRHAFVVHGVEASGGMDEISISGPSLVHEVSGSDGTAEQLTPEEVGLKRAPIESLQGGDAAVNAAILRSIFGGEQGPRRDVVLLNAAAVLICSGLAGKAGESLHERMRDGIQLAAQTIDRGVVTGLVDRLAES